MALTFHFIDNHFFVFKKRKRTAKPWGWPVCGIRRLVPAVPTKTSASASIVVRRREQGNVCTIFHQPSSTYWRCRHPSSLGPLRPQKEEFMDNVPLTYLAFKDDIHIHPSDKPSVCFLSQNIYLLANRTKNANNYSSPYLW